MAAKLETIKERPIIYSAAMVRAKLAGIKTQTRRKVKWKENPHLKKLTGLSLKDGYVAGPYFTGDPTTGWVLYPKSGIKHQLTHATHCPFGKVGDRLWGRESIGHTTDGKGKAVIVYRADDHARYLLAEDGGEGDLCGVAKVCKRFEPVGYWRSPIHMNRWAARILDEIIEIRVQRVQDISEEDAIAEGLFRAEGRRGTGYHGAGFDSHGGMTFHVPGKGGRCDCNVAGSTPAQCAYRELWDSINGKGSWESNPWVWVIVTKAVKL